jgi:hypothetical protein
VRAYAFLAQGAVAPLTGFAWSTPTDPKPGAWVDADTAPSEALRGCIADHLPYWLDDELWNIELAGALSQRDHLLVAERARLLGRIEAWVEPLAWEFVTACARRVAGRAATALREDGQYDAAGSLEQAQSLEELDLAASAAADAERPASSLAGYTADVCFYARDAGVAARGACVGAKMATYALAGDPADVPAHGERLEAERAWQAAWLTERLGISQSG